MIKEEPMIEVVAAAIFYSKQPRDLLSLKQTQFLSVRRGPGNSGAGSWEFPGGKIEAGETDEQALKREILEELSLSIQVYKKLGSTQHQYSSKKIHLHLYLCSTPQMELKLVDHDDFKWLLPKDFDQIQWSPADLFFLQLFKG